jgi:hypothetical protein
MDSTNLFALIRSLVSEPPDLQRSLFQRFVTKVLEHHERPAFTLAEIRARESTKAKGDLFESFCVMYLERILKYDRVWRLQDVPEETLAELGLGRRDFGIDLVAQHQGRNIAVQCKFKKPPRNGRYNCVNWKELSTFYALCARTQARADWQTHLVMTNARSVRRMGNRTKRDRSICYGTLDKMSSIDFAALLPQAAFQATPAAYAGAQLSLEDLRAARLRALSTPL